jgi:hypothetical protein
MEAPPAVSADQQLDISTGEGRRNVGGGVRHFDELGEGRGQKEGLVDGRGDFYTPGPPRRQIIGTLVPPASVGETDRQEHGSRLVGLDGRL